MLAQDKKRLLESMSWFGGPALGILLVAASILGNSGPGFFIFALVTAACFSAIVPLVQYWLRRRKRFAERPFIALSIALAIALASLLATSGVVIFNQW